MEMGAHLILDLPVPPSVNRARRIDWSRKAEHKHWQKMADAMVLGQRCRTREPVRVEKILGQFEVLVILSEKHTKIDLDNSLKCLIDYARRIELVVDDGPKYMRRVVVEWGHAPEGCRLVLRKIEAAA